MFGWAFPRRMPNSCTVHVFWDLMASLFSHLFGWTSGTVQTNLKYCWLVLFYIRFVLLDHSREISCFSSWKWLNISAGRLKINKTQLWKTQLFRQEHSTVFSKGFYNSIQCGCGTYVIVLCFQKLSGSLCGGGWETGLVLGFRKYFWFSLVIFSQVF